MSLKPIGRRSVRPAFFLVVILFTIGIQPGLVAGQGDDGGAVEVAAVIAGPTGDAYYVDIAFAAPIPQPITTDDGQVFVAATSVQIHIDEDFHLVAQADFFEDGAFFNGFCVEDPGACPLDSFVVEGCVSDDRRRVTLFFGPIAGLDIAPENMTVSILTTRRFPDAETAITFFPEGGGRIPAQTENVDDPLSMPPPSDTTVPGSSASAPIPEENSAPEPATTPGADAEAESDAAERASGATDANTLDEGSGTTETAGADTDADTAADGGSGGVSPAVWVALVLVVAVGGGLAYWYFVKRSEECEEELRLLNRAKAQVETAEQELADARDSLAEAETALAPHQVADATEEGRHRTQHFQRLAEASAVRDQQSLVVAAAEAEAQAQRELASDAQYTYDLCLGLVEPRGGGVSDIPETASSRPTTVVDDGDPPSAATTETPAVVSAPPAEHMAPPVPPVVRPKSDGDDPRDAGPPVGPCTEDDGPLFKAYGDALEDTLDLDYELSIDDTGLREIAQAESTAEELDEIAAALGGLGDASGATGDAIGALGITPSVSAAGFGNALDAARAVLQTTATLAAAAARVAGAVNRRNSMYLVKGQLHHYKVELQWMERWECQNGTWVCAGFELHRIKFERYATTELDEDRETFPPSKRGMRAMHSRFQARQTDWARKVADDQSKLEAYLNKPKTGPCA